MGHCGLSIPWIYCKLVHEHVHHLMWDVWWWTRYCKLRLWWRGLAKPMWRMSAKLRWWRCPHVKLLKPTRLDLMAHLGKRTEWGPDNCDQSQYEAQTIVVNLGVRPQQLLLCILWCLCCR